ncbi:unnamed protein product, partial [marine sediment metagenome]
MKVHEQKNGAVTVFRPEGPLAEADVDAFRQRLLEVMREDLGRIVLDLSAVPFVDSRGLEAMVDVTNEMASGG